MQLPAVADEDALDALMANAAQVEQCLSYAADRLGVGAVSRPVRGSALVGMNDASVIKLMAPFDHEIAGVERACLAALHDNLPVATPRIIDSGTLDGWSFVHMTRLPGRELKECWPSLDAAQQMSIAAQLGECLAALHRQPAPAEIPRCDWTQWVDDRVASLDRALHGAPAAWVEAVPELLASSDLTAGQTAWLHTEIMLEHLLVTIDGSHVRLSGLFDFEPSWVAPRDYEYASVAMFVGAGDSALLAEVLRAAGHTTSPKRLFAMALMHRYGRLAWYKQRLGGPADLEAWIDTFFSAD